MNICRKSKDYLYIKITRAGIRMKKPFHNILVVDDELICNYISIKWLRRLEVGEHIHVLNNGKAALDFLNDLDSLHASDCPDLILLDIKMPVMDGLEFLKEFERAELNCKDRIKIVLLTSSTKDSDIEEAYKYPIHGYLEKPLNREKLEYLISKVA